MAKSNGVWCVSILEEEGTRLHFIDSDFNVIKAARSEAAFNKQRHTSISWKPTEARAAKFLSVLNTDQYKLKGE